MRKHRIRNQRFRSWLTKITVTCLTLVVTLGGMAMNISADTYEVYTSVSNGVTVKVERSLNAESNEVELKFELTTDSNVGVESVQLNDETIDGNAFQYSKVIGSNGDYKFIIFTSRTTLAEEGNVETKVVERQRFDFVVKVNELAENDATDLTEVLPAESEIEVEEVDESTSTIVELEQSDSKDHEESNDDDDSENGPKYLNEIPNRDELDELLNDNQFIFFNSRTGQISIETHTEETRRSMTPFSGTHVVTGNKLIDGFVRMEWRANRSYYYELWSGFSQIRVNGDVGFCLEPAVLNVSTGSAYATMLEDLGLVRVAPDGRLAFNLTVVQQDKIELISEYTKYMMNQVQTQAEKDHYEANGQLMIWDALGWDITHTGGIDFSYAQWEINSLIAGHEDVPPWDGEVRDVRMGDIVDLSNSLNPMFTVYSYDGLEIIEDSGTSLKVKVVDRSATLVMRKKTSGKGTSYVYSDGSSQKAGILNVEDPMPTIIYFRALSSNLTFHKTDDLGRVVEGLLVETSYNSDFSAPAWSYYTDADGNFRTTQWEIGTPMYYREISGPEGIVIDKTVKTFVPSDDTHTINIVNDVRQMLIKKTDPQGQPVIATFDIYLETSPNTYTLRDTVTTSSTGYSLLDHLPAGKYKVVEVSVEAPYFVDPNNNTQYIVITDAGGVSKYDATFVNEIPEAEIEIVKNDSYSKPLQGVVFGLFSSSGTELNRLTTNASGKVKFTGLNIDTPYIVKEISVPTGVVLDETEHNFLIPYKDFDTPVVKVSKQITNKYQRGNVTLTKIEDSNDVTLPEFNGIALSGATIELYAKTDIYEGVTRVYRSGELIGTRITNNVGQVKFHNLPIGEYYAEEKVSPEGYIRFEGRWDISIKYDNQKVTTEITETAVTVTNKVIEGSVELTKRDYKYGTRLKGAIFELRYKGTLIGTYTSDDDGRITVNGLRYSTGGAYSFKEIAAPDKYFMSTEPILFDITQDGRTVYVDAPNVLIETHLQFRKLNEEFAPLQGVGFSIFNKDTGAIVELSYAHNGQIVTENTWLSGADGKVFINGLLTKGRYILKETHTLEGYQPIQPIEFTVDENSNFIDLGLQIGLTLDLGDIINEYIRGHVLLQKLDIDTNVPLAGFGFNIYDNQGTLVGYFETGADGTVLISDLQHGLYEIEEIKVGSDYGIDPNNNRQTVFIEEQGKTYSVTFKNKHAEIKTSASFIELDKNEPNIMTLVDVVTYTDLIPGKEYVVSGFLIDKDTNTPVIIDGAQVNASTTFTPALKDGVVEVEFTFDASELQSKTVVVFETLYRDNQEVVTHHDITDIDQTVEIPEIGTSASFTERDTAEPNIVTLTDEVHYNGLVVGKEYTVNGVLMDKETGEAILIDGAQVKGSTTFTPVATEGMVEVTFTFDASKLETKTVVVFEDVYEETCLIAVHHDITDVDQTIEVYTVRFNKVDEYTGKVLPGAVFTQWDANGNEVAIKVSDADGIVEFVIFEGEYAKFKETDAPKGYKLSDEVIEVVGGKDIDGNLYSFVYKNTRLPFISLPMTGVDNSFVGMLGIVTMILGALFIILGKRKAEFEITSSFRSTSNNFIYGFMQQRKKTKRHHNPNLNNDDPEVYCSNRKRE